MRRAVVAGGAFITMLVVLVLVGCQRPGQDAGPAAAAMPEITPSTTTPQPAEALAGFLYGRVTTDSGATYVGRLRWGGDQEAFWGDYFNGVKDENPWAAHVPERLSRQRPFEIFGIKFGRGEETAFSRPFMARFGDIARVEARGFDVRVTLKSGTVFDLDRLSANDFDDGVRIWTETGEVINLESWAGGVPPPPSKSIHTIEFLSAVKPGAAPSRLHGTVRTSEGEFTGFIQWDREKNVGSDTLEGRTAEGKVSVRFDTLRSVARRSRDSSVATTLDGREIVLSGTRQVGQENRGIYVDDRRYGRVLISWDAFERVDFRPGGNGPAYSDFPPGRPLTGSITTRDGRRLAGRLVYDLDESETTETLDAPSRGVDYTIPFGLVASIVPVVDGHARVTLHSGETLQLERAGDLGKENAGMLIFIDGGQRSEYVSWTDVERVDFDRPDVMFPPPAAR